MRRTAPHRYLPISLLIMLLACGVAWSADDAYLQRLERAERLVTQAEQHPTQAAQAARDAAALLPTGTTPALRELGATPSPESAARARAEIRALRRVATVTPVASGHAEPRDALGTVLRSGEFQSLKESRLPKIKIKPIKTNWLQQILRSIGNALKGIFKWFRNLFGDKQIDGPSAPGWLGKLGPVTRYILYAVLAVAVLFALGLLTNKLLIYRRRRQQQTGDAETPDATPRRRKSDPTALERALTQAEAMWQQGDTREAIRLLQRACLHLLDARGILHYDETRANGEVLRELRRQGRRGAHDALRPVMQCFDRSWYGFLDLSVDEFRTALEGGRRLQTAMREDAA